MNAGDITSGTHRDALARNASGEMKIETASRRVAFRRSYEPEALWSYINPDAD